MTDLHIRGSRIFGTTRGKVRWPYGLNDQLGWFDKVTDPEGWKAQKDLTDRQRLTIVEWAEQHGLRESTSGCCPGWLTRDTSRKCNVKDANGCDGGCSRFFDHQTWWLKDEFPAAVSGAPYGFFGEEIPRISEWLDLDNRLKFRIGDGWYGHGTVQTLIWRRDLLPNLHTAVLRGSFPSPKEIS